ncbi:MAG TPA: VOC family protein [Terriglobia bacterium]|nr:VOC family protein [Terriglobia bacterium]
MDPLLLSLRHVALNVRDVRKTADFYCDVLGLRVEWEPDTDNIYLTSGSDNLAIHQLPNGELPGPVQRVHHIGFVVPRPEDIDLVAGRVEARGIPLAQPIKTHRDGARSFYFEDPDGMLIQILYHPPISGAV